MNVDKMRRNLERAERVRVWSADFRPWGTTPIVPWSREQVRGPRDAEAWQRAERRRRTRP